MQALLKFVLAALFQPALSSFADSITFYGYNCNGTQFISTSQLGSSAKWCDVDGKYAIITHGWLEDCNFPNMIRLVANLQRVRGGCILCMDYRNYSANVNFFKLVNKYEGIQDVLVNKLKQLRDEGFIPIKGYMYGYSFGAHLVINSAFLVFGSREFGMIDVCDPAGVMFDNTYRVAKDASQAAINVQCIHTSILFGSSLRTCTQNWLMGCCGLCQSAALSVSKNSHQLCGDFYNNAFDHSFPAVKQPWYCPKPARLLTTWPAHYRMGYDASRLIPNTQPSGTLYACTSKDYPYNC